MSTHLESNGKNILTLFSMPLLDMGDKPQTFNVKKNESE